MKMKVLSTRIITNSEMSKNYSTCREQAEEYGKIFIFKNNEPDAVLFSITEYEKYSALIESAESLDANDIDKLLMAVSSNYMKRSCE